MNAPLTLESQLAGLDLRPGRPIIVSDADEVLFAFMDGFEKYLLSQEHWFDWGSYALTGNVRRRQDDAVVEAAEVKRLLGTFFAERTEHLEPIPGAADALAALSERAQVVVLSNVPLGQRDARLKALASNRMPYPLIANEGGKGPAVRALADRVGAPVLFIDDIPHQHKSVRGAVGDAYCLHFVGDPRLARLIDKAADSDHRADSWDLALPALEAQLARFGF